MIIRARAPLRLGLAGGGTDVSPFCDLHGGYVLNATIDRFSYAIIRPLNEAVVRFAAADQEKAVALSLSDLNKRTGMLCLHQTVYGKMVELYNASKPIPVELTTFSDAPPGSGLGSSSALVVVMIQALAEFLGVTLDDYSVARLAFQVERVDCGLQGGRQDQYSAACGGFNFMEFYADERAVINPLRIKSHIICELEASLLLLHTGISRESSNIIQAQSENIHAGVLDAIDGMHGLKNEALIMKECLLKGDFDRMVQSMRQGWESKKRTAAGVSNPKIDAVYDAAVRAGALAGKISGAGGGGFMMFLVPPEKRIDVTRRLAEFGKVSSCHFTKQGAQAWRIPEHCAGFAGTDARGAHVATIAEQ